MLFPTLLITAETIETMIVTPIEPASKNVADRSEKNMLMYKMGREFAMKMPSKERRKVMPAPIMAMM